MLSPGAYWQDVPKDRRENLDWREKLLREVRLERLGREAIWGMCAEDILFYVNVFCWTFDPRTPFKFLPFITWPIQDKAFLSILECIEEGRDLVIEKSRDMGASWMSLTVMEWLWHFHAGNSFLMVSRKEDLVDAPGDPDSLFWKIDFIHRHLPAWLCPRIDRRKLHFGNVDNGSTIDGESTTAAAGVGGRRTAMFIDEFSRIEEGYQLLAGTADTTRCRIFNFTPFGTSNAAYKLARRGDVRKLRLHWSEHPEKAAGLYRYDPKTSRVEALDKTYAFPPDFDFVMDGRLRSPWYDAECRRRANDREVAQMLDIDYQGSAYQFFDKLLIIDLQRTYCVPAYWEGDVDYDQESGRFLGFTKCVGGPLRLWLLLDGDGRPAPGKYALGCDLSSGSGTTNSCVSIANCSTGEKVGEYASPYLRPEQMAPRAVALAWAFKDGSGDGAILCWETPGPGYTFGKRVLELGYRQLHYRKTKEGVGAKISDIPGWHSNAEAKDDLLREYRAALASRDFLNRSTEALEECLSFVVMPSGHIEHADNSQNLGDPTGAKSNHGDRVIADALAWRMARPTVKVQKKIEKKEAPLLSLAWRKEYHERLERLREGGDEIEEMVRSFW